LRPLEEKEAFVGTQLVSYQSQIAAKEKQGETVNPKHVEALIQIDASHKTMVRGIAILEEPIEHMELLQHELSQKNEECQVVYETAERLQALQLEEEQNE
jgi:phosphotransferase system HPr-like phosphotransfer protein